LGCDAKYAAKERGEGGGGRSNFEPKTALCGTRDHRKPKNQRESNAGEWLAGRAKGNHSKEEEKGAEDVRRENVSKSLVTLI